MNLDCSLDRIKSLDLAGFLSRHYNIRVNGSGMGLCPFHSDTVPSLSVQQKNGTGVFKCHGCGAAGTIIDAVMKLENKDLPAAVRRIMEFEGIRDESPPPKRREVIREFVYHDESGKPISRKLRWSSGEKFSWQRLEPDGRWVGGIRGVKRVLFNLHRIKDEPVVILCEGERDASNLAALGFPATSGPNGKDSLPDETLPSLKDKKVHIIFDVGNDEAAQAVAKKISTVAREVFILKVPMDCREADITDYLATFKSNEERRRAFGDLLLKGEAFTAEPGTSKRKPFTGTLGEFFTADIVETEELISGLLRREEFLYVGGVKHSHKTSLVSAMGLHYAAGQSPWLVFNIAKPGRFLMVQQELGEAEFRKRLRAAIAGGGFDASTLDRFIPYTSTGDPIKLNTPAGIARLEALVSEFKPDILALDPQASFVTGGENDDKTQAALRDVINLIKTKYKIGVVLSHHFSSKRPAGSLDAPTELGGWFRGHSCLSDAADAQIGLHRLPGHRDNPNLRLKYEDYNQVEVTLRNGKWPPRFATEFDESSFLLKVSDVWHEMGARIPLGDVREVVEAHGGEIMLKDLIVYYQSRLGGVSPHTVKGAARREETAGYITTETCSGRGKPILIKSRAGGGD